MSVPTPDAALPGGMLAILVADVRGYTAFTHQHGDAAGAALALRFADLAAEATAAEGGQVVEVRGDEVLAVFSSARAALRAAVSLLARCAQESSAALPLRAGIGLDVGEPVPVPGGYRGEAINTAARLCAQAGPGEVLATEAVVGLARHVEGLNYLDRGALALKGISRPVRVWLVAAGDADAVADSQLSPATAAPVSSFGELLHRYRLAAGLSQEQLAERAGVSVQALSVLENGRRKAPYRHTVQALATGLGLTAVEAAALEAAVVRVRLRSEGASDEPAAQEPIAADLGDGASPPPATSRAAKTNLPVQLTGFVGRAREQAAVRDLLSGASLVTLTGAGGAGKTRLALEVAGQQIEQWPDGVWLVELAPLADPSVVPQAVADVMGVREIAGRSILAAVSEVLQPRNLLLVLDNCEHLVDACAELAAALLRACPSLHILATSRETLEVPGEAIYRVPSLAVPDLAALPGEGQLGEYEAVQLFVERAQSRRSGFVLSARNARAVAEICVRLDGMPLAIELAAARVGSLPVETIATRLDDRFRLLTAGPRTVLPRQQTLRAVLDWSYDLLSEKEQLLLVRLSVFAGGWTLPAGEAVCSGEGIKEWEVIDLLGGLVNKSLVQAQEVDGEDRYGLLETVRQYAQDKLDGYGETADLRGRHLNWFTDLVETQAPLLETSNQQVALALLEIEHENIRIALANSAEGADPERALRLVGALSPFWDLRSYLRGGLREGLDHINSALGRTTEGKVRRDNVSPALWARAARWCARLHERVAEYEPALQWIDRLMADVAVRDGQDAAEALAVGSLIDSRQGEYTRAFNRATHALQMAQHLNAAGTAARAHCLLGMVAKRQGNNAAALPHVEAALALFRQVGEPRGLGLVYNLSANVYESLGQWRKATQHYHLAYEIFTQLNDLYNSALVANNLGEAARTQGHLDIAQVHYEEALDGFERVGASAYACGVVRVGMGALALRRGNAAVACEYLSIAISEFSSSGSREYLPEAHRLLADAALQLGDIGRAHTECTCALDLARSLSMRVEEGSCLRTLGLTCAAQAVLEEAESHLLTSIAILSETDNSFEEANSRLALAHVYRMANRAEDARISLAHAAELFGGLAAGSDIVDELAKEERLLLEAVNRPR